ncbi:MAG TPA: hydrogenase expression/formation protein HypE [Negativicutes bacterium]|nr:hydrogenase expression/formation protein HypE [Negativicutes bacterium]
MRIEMAHGSGGKSTTELIGGIFGKYFGNEILNRMEDAAVLELGGSRVAFTTDSFVVKPLFFNGGDIGKLSICGTVNDLLMMGAVPKYLTCGFILEEGLEVAQLERIVRSMKEAADEAGVVIAAGDTKVVEGSGGLFINTSGIGIVRKGADISARNAKPGDAVILSGSLGNHHACILSQRMGITNEIMSDCAPLKDMVDNLLDAGIRVKTMRDVTRGGLATVLNEIAESSSVSISIREESLVVDEAVRGFCDILGLDPLYMGNEGKMACIVDGEDAEKALAITKGSKYGEKAEIIGSVKEADIARVTLTTRLGGRRRVDVLVGEGLPRIC